MRRRVRRRLQRWQLRQRFVLLLSTPPDQRKEGAEAWLPHPLFMFSSPGLPNNVPTFSIRLLPTFTCSPLQPGIFHEPAESSKTTAHQSPENQRGGRIPILPPRVIFRPCAGIPAQALHQSGKTHEGHGQNAGRHECHRHTPHGLRHVVQFEPFSDTRKDGQRQCKAQGGRDGIGEGFE